jgi:hypothetical protein
MEQRAEAFLNAFGEIEQVLRRQLRAQAFTTFSQLLIDATKRSPGVRQFEVDLREYAELRNAIVHQRTDGHAIAEPYVDVVRDIERIRDRLVRPPGLLPLAAQPVVTCEASDHIGSAAMQMRQGNFSQLPVYEDARFLQLLTAETITRWMAFTLRDNDGLLEEVPVAEVLPHAETTDNVAFLSRGATAFDALGAFEEFFQRGQFLNAILLTEAGSTAQAPLGIVAVADIPEILASTR